MDEEPDSGNRVNLPGRIWACPLDTRCREGLAERKTLFSDPKWASPWEYGVAAVAVE